MRERSPVQHQQDVIRYLCSVQEACCGQRGAHDDQLQRGALALICQLAAQRHDAQQQPCTAATAGFGAAAAAMSVLAYEERKLWLAQCRVTHHVRAC